MSWTNTHLSAVHGVRRGLWRAPLRTVAPPADGWLVLYGSGDPLRGTGLSLSLGADGCRDRHDRSRGQRMTNEPFFTPNLKAAPARQPTPGVEVWRLRHA